MAAIVDVLIEEPRWDALDLPQLADRAARSALDHLNLQADGFEISLLACNDARIAALNSDFRDKSAATNVLSWPSAERGATRDGGVPSLPSGGELGDIAIAYETCLDEASTAGLDISAHVTHLVVHAVLHLLGYDHVRGHDAALMEGLETEILASLGLPDPYSRG